MESYVCSSESVACGHPDKLCDQVSDAVLDAVLRNDPVGRVACETYVTQGLIIVGGEITTKTYIDVRGIALSVIDAIGYNDPKFGFDYKTCAVLNAINTQSPDIAMGVDRGGAGDQGMMTGFACRDTEELMPLPLMLSHKLVRAMKTLREKKKLPFLGPDGKAQISVRYEAGKPVVVTSVVLACQHTEAVLDKKKDRMSDEARQEIIDVVAMPVVKRWIDDKTVFFVNETGKFVIGGPQSDTGMTGRKIVVDTYGGFAPVGGGAFSGKDPTKVDRSAAYMARYIAKNIVAAGLADKCLLQIAYCIGKAEPVSVMIDCYGTGKLPDQKIAALVRKTFPLTPRGIIKELDLLKPVYQATACHGHFGRSEQEFTWERVDRAEALRAAL